MYDETYQRHQKFKSRCDKFHLIHSFRPSNALSTQSCVFIRATTALINPCNRELKCAGNLPDLAVFTPFALPSGLKRESLLASSGPLLIRKVANDGNALRFDGYQKGSFDASRMRAIFYLAVQGNTIRPKSRKEKDE